MKRLVIILSFLVALPACWSSGEDEALREQTRQQIVVVRDQLKGLDRSHLDLQTQLGSLQSSIDEMSYELTRVDARLVAAKGSNSYLYQLSTEGFGESPGHWVMENQAYSTNVLFLFALAVVLLWVFYRMRLRGGEALAMAEVDRVLTRLNEGPAGPLVPAPVAPTASPAPTPPPAPVVPETTAPKPEPAQAPTQEPVAAPAAPPPADPDPTPVAVKKESTPPAGVSDEKPSPDKAKPIPADKADADKPRRAVARREVRRKPANRSQAKKCKVDGCPNKHRSKGYCNKHYQQWRKSGSVEGEKEE